MKILVIGDFHGKFTDKQVKKLKKENPAFVFSPGDFCGNENWGKIFFKHFYAKNERERKKVPKIVKDALKKEEKIATENGILVLKKLTRFEKPLYAVHGNWDPGPYGTDLLAGKLEYTKSDVKRFRNVGKRNFNFMDFKVKDFGDFVLVGGTSSTAPGKVDKKSLQRFLKKYDEDDPREAKKIIKIMKRQSARRKKKYEAVFKKAKNLKKPIVFLTHNCPYNTKLDLIRDKKADKLAKGKHYGSYLERLIIKRFKPDLVLCGHMQ